MKPQVKPQDVLDLWFGAQPLESAEQVRKHATEVWRAGEALDAPVRERFGEAFERAVAGELDHWCETTRGKLALLILLDQFSRHIYRDKPEQYRGDAKALQLARELHDSGDYRELAFVERSWAFMPFGHHESIEGIRRIIELADELHDEAPEDFKAFAEIGCKQSRRALDIFERFGRFPHRNAILGRQSTEAEQAFLADYSHGPNPQMLAKAGVER